MPLVLLLTCSPSYLSAYGIILLLNCIIYGAFCLYYNYGTQRASRYVNIQLVDSILHATMRCVDISPNNDALAEVYPAGWTRHQPLE